jgi:hypothetical protein
MPETPESAFPATELISPGKGSRADNMWTDGEKRASNSLSQPQLVLMEIEGLRRATLAALRRMWAGVQLLNANGGAQNRQLWI